MHMRSPCASCGLLIGLLSRDGPRVERSEPSMNKQAKATSTITGRARAVLAVRHSSIAFFRSAGVTSNGPPF